LKLLKLFKTIPTSSAPQHAWKIFFSNYSINTRFESH